MDELATLQKLVKQWRLVAIVAMGAMAMLLLAGGATLWLADATVNVQASVMERQAQSLDEVQSRSLRWQAAAELWMLKSPEGRAELDRMRREQLNAPDTIERPR